MVTNEQILFLEHIAYKIRLDCLRMTTHAGSGHITSCLSAADIVAALFFHAMSYDLTNPNYSTNDQFILSKGHAAPLLYAVYHQLGVLTDDDIMGYRSFNSVLEGHPTPRFKYVKAATGSLGQGLSIAAGIAYAGRMKGDSFSTYCLLGDSEMAEGSVWEALEIAAFYKLSSLVAIIDCNRLGQSTPTMDQYHLEHYVKKGEAFGWQTYLVDGHDIPALIDLFDVIKKSALEKPTLVVAKTVKGYGIKQVENKEGYHGVAFKKEQLPSLEKELADRFANAVLYRPVQKYQPPQPAVPSKEITKNVTTVPAPSFEKTDTKTELVPTRKAYGIALAALGEWYEEIISLDAEVKNSTFAELFEKRFPSRFIQCFVAEQNMLGMAVGTATMKKIPFVSTFGAFFTRAYDQIRMAAIGRSPLRLVGSHVGVSIGHDGPSQMALEDIAIMSAVPESIILYPCDAVSTYRLVQLMINYHQGISYLRTTRSATPIIYSNDDEFIVGGCAVLKKSESDVACIVAAGITLHEALAAYEQLKKENILITIIDAYSIKPLDAETIALHARAAKNKIITVEDHYLQGGLGATASFALRNHNFIINSLAVTHVPRSGSPEELRAWAGIDAAAIVKTVKKIITP